MAQQQRGPINGLDPLIYTGGLPNLVVMTRRPTVKDFEGFFLGHWWIIPKTNDGSTPTEEIWVLVGKQQHIATWKRLHGGSGPVANLIVGNQYFTTPGAGTYTPTAGMRQVLVECIGGGGGASGSCGGGGGGYARKMYTADQIGASQPFVVGAAGSGASVPNPGTNGANTTFSSGSLLITASGGTGGGQTGNYNAAGGTGTGGDINISGGNGVGKYNGSTEELSLQSRMGGGSVYAPAASTPGGVNPGVNGIAGNLYGGGGTPGLADFSGTTGGDGAQGIIIVTEYFA